jgi:transposase
MGTSSTAVVQAIPGRKALPSGKRQRRSPEIKRKIVEETLAPGASVARVARAHGVNANQVFQWRRLYHAGRLGAAITTVSRLLPVSVSEAATTDAMAPSAGEIAVAVPPGGEASGAQAGTIHLQLRKARLRIEGRVDPVVLRQVLKALLG